MAVITISRQLGSHGDTVAQLLCERLGYRYFDKNLMLGLAVQAGLTPAEVVDLSDEQHRARSLIERLFGNYAAPMADPGTWAVSVEIAAQERMTAADIRQLIQAAHAQGDVVIVGRGGKPCSTTRRGRCTCASPRRWTCASAGCKSARGRARELPASTCSSATRRDGRLRAPVLPGGRRRSAALRSDPEHGKADARGRGRTDRRRLCRDCRLRIAD